MGGVRATASQHRGGNVQIERCRKQSDAIISIWQSLLVLLSAVGQGPSVSGWLLHSVSFPRERKGGVSGVLVPPEGGLSWTILGTIVEGER